jgi:hypothetical protein
MRYRTLYGPEIVSRHGSPTSVDEKFMRRLTSWEVLKNPNSSSQSAHVCSPLRKTSRNCKISLSLCFIFTVERVTCELRP